MDREVLAEPRVAARLARLSFARIEREHASATVRALLDGAGTLVFLGDMAIARQPGTSSPRAFLTFLDDALAAARLHREHAASGTRESACALADRDVALGFPERALERLAAAPASRAVILLRARAELSRGDVARAREQLAGLAAGETPLALAAELLLAERRAPELVTLVRNASAADPASRLALARALLETGERAAAQGILAELVAQPSALGVSAEELLVRSVRPEPGHAHGR
ncbi:MAG: hypothetical protein HZB39_13340 [Planctomycetes bacterium]|nr:hypothetical protein [Planctomycetota bacterium]